MMIALHRLAHEHEPFYLNADLIVMLEATPDTVIALSTGTKIVVRETPDEVSDLVRETRVHLLSDVLSRGREERAVCGRGAVRLAPGANLEAAEQMADILPFA